MKHTDRIRLLIALESEAEAKRILSMLQASSIICRPAFIQSVEQLHELLSEQKWDMFIGLTNHPTIDLSSLASTLRSKAPTMPSILLAEEEQYTKVINQALKLGFSDIIPLDQDQHLSAAIRREWTRVEALQAARSASRRVQALETKIGYLRDDARTPIAYTQDGLFTYVNESFSEFLEFDADELLVTPLADIINDKKTLKKVATINTTATAANIERINVDFLSAQGQKKSCQITLNPTTFDEDTVNEIQILNARLAFTATQDDTPKVDLSISTIPNKRQFFEQGSQALAEEGNPVAQLCWIQAINFDDATAPLSFIERESLFEMISEHIHTHFDPLGLWGNLGDACFGLISSMDTLKVASNALNDTIDEMSQQIWEIKGKTTRLHFTAGITPITDTTNSIDELIESAQKAWHDTDSDAKRTAIFIPDHATEALKKPAEIIQTIKEALTEDRFKLLFQPIINLQGNKEELYEVFVRLIDEDNNEISPNIWRKDVLSAGLGSHIDRWVIREAARTLISKRDDYRQVRFIINLSESALDDDGMPSFIQSLFKASRLTKDKLIFQLSENDVSRRLTAATLFSEKLMGLQCRVGLSHFGSSMAPFDNLAHIMVDWVKIDGSYTQDLQDGQAAEKLTEMLTQLHEDGRKTIVPMVENVSCMNALWQAGAQHIQGYYVQAPQASINFDFNLE